MQDANTTVITARLTRDPELRHTPKDIPVTTLRVAVQRPNGPEAADRGAAFVDVEVWNGSAEASCRYLNKGSRVAVEGRLDHQEWEKDGAKRSRVFIVAQRVHFLDGAGKAEPKSSEPEPTDADADAALSGMSDFDLD